MESEAIVAREASRRGRSKSSPLHLNPRDETLASVPVSPVRSTRRRKMTRRIRPRSHTLLSLVPIPRVRLVQSRHVKKARGESLSLGKIAYHMNDGERPSTAESAARYGSPPPPSNSSQIPSISISPLRLSRPRSMAAMPKRKSFHECYEKIVASLENSVTVQAALLKLDKACNFERLLLERSAPAIDEHQRNSESLAELLKCPGMWSSLSDDDDDVEEEEEKIKDDAEAKPAEPERDRRVSHLPVGHFSSWFSSFTATARDEKRSMAGVSKDNSNKTRSNSRREKLCARSEAYEKSVRRALEQRKRQLCEAERRERSACTHWKRLRRRVSKWYFQSRAYECLDRRWILVQQRLELTKQLAKSAADILSRRLLIASSLRESHNEELSRGVENSDELDADERSTLVFVSDTPRVLLRRDEQREGMKQFVKILDTRIRDETESLFAMHSALMPVTDRSALEEMRALSERAAALNERWDQIVEADQTALETLAFDAREIVDRSRDLFSEFSAIAGDTRREHGRTLDAGLAAIRRMYRNAVGRKDVEILRQEFSHAAMKFAHRFFDILVREIWGSTERGSASPGFAELRCFVEALIFGQFPELKIARRRSTSSERDDTDTVKMLRELPLEQFGFDPASVGKFARTLRPKEPPFPETTGIMRQLLSVPRSPAMIVQHILRLVQILQRETRLRLGDEAKVDAAEVLLPALIVAAIHLDCVSTLRSMLERFVVPFVASPSATGARGRGVASVVIRSGEVEYYLTSVVAALTWIETPQGDCGEDEIKYEGLLGDVQSSDYEGLLEAFASAADRY